MKHWFWFLALILPISSLAGNPPPVSEAKAEAIIRSLPEFVELTRRYQKDVDIDGPIPYTPLPSQRAALGTSAWQIDVYVIIHDDKNTSHGTRWAFFRANASTGEVWVDDFDFKSDDFVLVSLNDWRKRLKKAEPAATAQRL